MKECPSPEKFQSCDLPRNEINIFHFWCDCSSITSIRLEFFLNFFLYDIPTISEFGIDKFIGYANGGKRFKMHNMTFVLDTNK